MAAEAFLALDFGGTKLAVGVLSRGQERWLARGRCPTPASAGASAVFARILQLADEQLARARAQPVAVGVSFDGPVDLPRRRPLRSHHVAGWEDFALCERLQAHYGVPVALENDANAAAWGEWLRGAGRGCRQMLYVTVSTGIGGGLVLEGQLYHGAQGLAGEIGHMVFQPDGPLCSCGRRGCLEALAAGPALLRRYRELLLAQGEGVEGGSSISSARELSAAAQAGDPLARQALQEGAQALGRALGSVLNLLNLERIVLGGGVLGAGEPYLRWVRQAAQAVAFAEMTVEIVPAALGEAAPLWGAALLAAELVEHYP